MSLKDYCERNPWPKIHNLRWIIWKTEKTLGEKAPFVTRFGKKVLIDVQEFEKWLKSDKAHAIKCKWIEEDKRRRG
jgi:hypothetical protein